MLRIADVGIQLLQIVGDTVTFYPMTRFRCCAACWCRPGSAICRAWAWLSATKAASARRGSAAQRRPAAPTDRRR